MDRDKLIEQIADYIQSAPDGRYLISKIQSLHVPIKLNYAKWFDIHMCPLYDFIDYFLQYLENDGDSHIIECGPDYVARSLMRFWFFILYLDQIMTEVIDTNNLILGGFKFKIAQDPLDNERRFYLFLNGASSEAGFKVHLENVDKHELTDIIVINIYIHLDGFIFGKHALNDHDDLFEFPIRFKASTQIENQSLNLSRSEIYINSNNLKKSDIIKFLNNLF